MKAGRMEGACPICGSEATSRVGALPFYLRTGTAESDIWYCRGCRSWWRSFPTPINLHEHFDVASYSDPELEERWRRNRRTFFDHLVRLTLHASARPEGKIDVLDVGCAYGHLMERFADHDCHCTGIEPVAAQRERLRQRGAFAVYPSLEDLPDPQKRFDAILSIDSLYYMPGPPVAHLRRLGSKLKPNGVIVLRIANRGLLLEVHRRLGRPIPGDIFGDALFCYSHRGLKSVLAESGLTLESWHAYEHKNLPGSGPRGFVMNRLLPTVADLTGWKISPGTTYLCRRADAPRNEDRA
jgi:SAM-dependent methyltransferase